MDRPMNSQVFIALFVAMIFTGCSTNTNRLESTSDRANSEIVQYETRDTFRPADIADNAKKAMVTIRSFRNGRLEGTGSGFFVREDGVVATNLHVISGGNRLEVETSDGEIFDTILVLSLDERRDLVILQIPASDVHTLRIADDRSLDIADSVYAIGNPLGLTGTFSDGILSGRRVEDGVSLLQITAPISPGSSGGAVLNESGDVIGVATEFYAEGQNLNLAVPARHILGLLALPYEPVEFGEFAAASWPSTDIGEMGRAEESKQLIDLLPEATKADLRELEPHEQQVAVRLLAFAAIAGENDWEYYEESKMGIISVDQVEGMNVTLYRGDYMVLGVCDDDCTDLDVVVLGSQDEIVARDVDNTAEAVVQFSVESIEHLSIKAKMVSCSTTNCAYALQLLKSN
jgi:hypothetical protein